MGFSKKNCVFLKTANGGKFVLGCNCFRPISQKVEKLAPSWKQRLVFRRKNLSSLKTAKGSKFALECNWISKIPQKVEKLDPSWNKDLFFEEKSWVF